MISLLIQSASNLPSDASALESAISTLEREITIIDSSSGRWEIFLTVFSIFVLVGVAMEIIVVLGQNRDETLAWQRATVLPPEKPSANKLKLEIASIALVSLGIAGEIGIGAWVSHRNGALRDKHSELRNKSDQLVGLLRLEAIQAQQEAEQAKERTAKIEASMMLRHLSKEQAAALCAAIPKSHINEVAVTSSSQDWEAFRYAQDFDEALRHCTPSAGLDRSGAVGDSFWSQNVVFGVWLRVQKHPNLDDPRSPNLTINPLKRQALAKAVRDALVSHGVKVEGISDEGRSMLDIYVGPRFPPKDEPETTKSYRSDSFKSPRKVESGPYTLLE